MWHLGSFLLPAPAGKADDARNGSGSLRARVVSTRVRQLLCVVLFGAVTVTLVVVPTESASLGLLLGGVFVAAPYAALLAATHRLPGWLFAVVLAGLLCATAVGLMTASRSSTGGLVFLWLVPLQVVVILGMAGSQRVQALRHQASGSR